MQLLPGHSFGRYKIIEKLPFGEGGMAIVYKAFDQHLDCEVAVKIIRTDRVLPAALDRTMKRFEREAKNVARLVHPNIVKVMDFGEQDGITYLVMPLITGGTLRQYLAKNGKMDWMDAANLLLPIANALGYAHKMKIIHRDVKPSNILLTPERVPLLTDFGVAKVLDEEGTMNLTGTNATVGTPEYMAPEQIVSKTVDHRADIYALGVVFYEMITGMCPVTGVTPLETLFKHASEPLPPPTSVNPAIPQGVEDFLMKALMKKPEDRFSSMSELENALRALINGTPLTWDTQTQVSNEDPLKTVDEQSSTVDQISSTDSYVPAPSFDQPSKSTPMYPYSVPSPVYPAQKSLLPWIMLGVLAIVGVIVVVLVTSSKGTLTEPAQEENGSSLSSVLTQTSSNEVSTPMPVGDTNNNTPLVVVVTNTPMKSTQTKTPTPVVCPGMPPSRVKVGDKVEVCTDERLRLRETPANESVTKWYLVKGTELEIIGGHVCADKSTWWEVLYKMENGEEDTGWVKEGTDDKVKYYLCPIENK